MRCGVVWDSLCSPGCTGAAEQEWADVDEVEPFNTQFLQVDRILASTDENEWRFPKLREAIEQAQAQEVCVLLWRGWLCVCVCVWSLPM